MERGKVAQLDEDGKFCLSTIEDNLPLEQQVKDDKETCEDFIDFMFDHVKSWKEAMKEWKEKKLPVKRKLVLEPEPTVLKKPKPEPDESWWRDRYCAKLDCPNNSTGCGDPSHMY